MAITVRINEQKEQVNELLGTLLAWGLIAGLLAKLFGFKFNISDTDQMRQWGFQLGDAIKFSRSRIKKSNLNPQEQQEAEQIIDEADQKIRRTVQKNSDIITKNPSAAKTLHTNDQVMSILNDAVSRIQEIFHGDRQKAEEVAEPLRQKVEELEGTLGNVTKQAALAAFAEDSGLKSAIKNATKGSDEVVKTVLNKIAEKVKS
jgi:hypothetical protein